MRLLRLEILLISALPSRWDRWDRWSRVVILARAGYYLRYGSLNSPGASTRCLSERLEWMDEHVFLPSTAQVV